MGIRLTGISTPIGGLDWEYTDKKESATEPLSQLDHKIKVFISSTCGGKYERVRSELKTCIESTGIADAYVFEAENAATISAGSHYRYELEDSDVCIFLIDNADGISHGVQDEIDIVNTRKIKALYYFCDETSKEKTQLEQGLMGVQFAKSKTVHKFDDLVQYGAKGLLNDIVFIYHNYCKNRLVEEDASEDIQSVSVVGIEKIQQPVMPKTVLENIDKSTDCCLKYALGCSVSRFSGEKENSGEIDEWCMQFLPILFEGKSIRQFNVSLYLETLKKIQTDEYFKIVEGRWKAIQAYFMGNVTECIEHLENVRAIAQKTNQPLWVINDILIDLRNQQATLNNMHNIISMPEAQNEIIGNAEEVYYPLIDRVNESLYQSIVENEYKRKIASPYSITYSNDCTKYGKYIVSSLIIAMYNGSLTHILLTYNKVRDFIFYVSEKNEDWILRRNLLQLAVFNGTAKEIRQLQNIYPEMLNQMTAKDANWIMNFCNNHPLEYKKFDSQLRGFGTVAYYLSDGDFSDFEANIVEKIKHFLDDEEATLSIAPNIFECLSGAAYRMNQDKLVDICCLFMERNCRRWYRKLFTLIADGVDWRKVSDDSAKRLISDIIALLKDEQSRIPIKDNPIFLFILRKQNQELTNELDSNIAQYLPDLYAGDYRLETTDSNSRDMEDFVRLYADRIRENNDIQGKNGEFFGFASRNAAKIRSIFLSREKAFSTELMKTVVSVSSETLLRSKEGITTKLDTVSLLISIIIKFPEIYDLNSETYESIYDQRESVEVSSDGFFETNIDSVALKIALVLLFTAMKKETYSDIMELLPLAQNDTATSISIARIIAEYLEVSDDVRLPDKIEAVVLQNVLVWLRSDRFELRYNAVRVLLTLARNPENANVVNRQLINLVDSGSVHIKNLILRRMCKLDCISNSTKDYIMEKCDRDPNYVVRMVCSEIKKA